MTTCREDTHSFPCHALQMVVWFWRGVCSSGAPVWGGLLVVTLLWPFAGIAADDVSGAGEADGAPVVTESAEAGLEASQPADRAREADPSKAQRVPPDSPRRLLDSGGFPPVGMRLDHPQEKGHWTFSYRYVRNNNDGLGNGRQSVDPASILGNPWTEVPTSQIDTKHVAGVAYAPLDRLTFELSLPYRRREMDVLTATGTRQLSARGIGDARFVFIIPFIENADQATHVTLGFTFPTGSIDESDENGDLLPYSMQLGSGTWDLVWGVTYTGREGRLGWGGEIDGVYRLGENQRGYTQGTVYEASAWLTVIAHEWLSVSGRLGWSRRTNVHGSDPALDPLVNPANDPYRQAWNRLEAGPGANIFLPILGGQRFAVEALFPLVQVLDGPQVKRQWTLTAGFQWLY